MSDASPVLLTPDVVGGLAGKRVLVVGDIMLDAYLIGDADRISPEAPVPVVRIEKERYLLGGAGNVARNIVALGGVATLAGVMGKDASADRIRGLVRDEGICGAFVALPQRPTTVKTRVMARRQQMLRLDSEDASPLSSADQEALPSLRSSFRRTMWSSCPITARASSLCRSCPACVDCSPPARIR